MWVLGGIRTRFRLDCLGQLLSIKPNLWLLISVAYSHKKKKRLKPKSRSAFTHVSPFLFLKNRKAASEIIYPNGGKLQYHIFYTRFSFAGFYASCHVVSPWCLISARNSNGGFKSKLLIERSLLRLLDTAAVFEHLGNAFTTEKAATMEPNLFLTCHSVGPVFLPAPVQLLCPSSTTQSTSNHRPCQSDLQGRF